MLGADPVPRTRAEAERLVARLSWASFAPTSAREDFATWCSRHRRGLGEAPVQKLLMSAAVDLMPRWAREMHGLSRPCCRRCARRHLRACEHIALGLRRRAYRGRIDCVASSAWQFGAQSVMEFRRMSLIGRFIDQLLTMAASP